MRKPDLILWRAATSLPSARAAESVLDRVREVMSDDLQTPGALDAIDNWARDSLHSGGPDPSGPATGEEPMCEPARCVPLVLLLVVPTEAFAHCAKDLMGEVIIVPGCET